MLFRSYRDMEALRYQKSVIETGRIEGRAEGRAEGREEGREEGKAEGRAEGFVEGEKRKQQEIAGKMKSSGIALETIIQITGLSREEIEQL